MKNFFLFQVVLALFSLSYLNCQAKTATYTVNRSSDDSTCPATGSCAGWSTQTSVNFPYANDTSLAFFRWPINLPQDITLSSVNLKIYPTDTSSVSSAISLDFVAEDSCPTLSGELNIGGNPVDWSFSNWTVDTANNSPDIKSIFSSWLSREGYQGGKYFGIRGVWSSGGAKRVRSFDYDQNQFAPVLTVEYTGGSAVVEMMMAEPHVKTKQYVHFQIWNQNQGDILHVYLDDQEVSTYEIQSNDVPENSATRFEKVILLDYTGLEAGQHHIDGVLTTSNGQSRMAGQVEGKNLKTWTTTHSGYPKVGIDENNAICIRNDAGNGCDTYFPLTPFIWQKEAFYQPQCYYGANGVCHPFSLAVNGTYAEGWWPVHDATSWSLTLDQHIATIDPDSAKHWYAVGPSYGYKEDVVSLNKSSEGLLGWLWEDEPGLHSMTFEFLRNNYEQTKVIDTDHPHFMNHYGYDMPEGAAMWNPEYHYLTGNSREFIADVTGLDYYPYEFTTKGVLSGVQVSLEGALSADDSLIAYNYGLIPHTTIVQPSDEKTAQTYDSQTGTYTYAEGSTQQCVGTSGPLGSTVWTPMPTTAQLKNELWLRAIHGAKGIGFFPYFCPIVEENIAVVRKFKQDLESGSQPLSEVVLAPKSSKYIPQTRSVNGYGVNLNHATAVAGTDGRVDYMTREYDGNTWIFAARVKKISGEFFSACNTVGPSAGAVRCEAGENFGVWPDSTNTNIKTASIPVTGLQSGTQIEVYDESRTITSDDGEFSDSFADYDVHIYKISEAISLQADFDSDSDVDIFDYNILLTNFGTTGDCENQADADGDCNVGIFDYNILLGEFGSGT